MTVFPVIILILSCILSLGNPSPENLPDETFFDKNGALLIQDYKQICGRRFIANRAKRVVGGSDATFGKWPWQIYLKYWTASKSLKSCGATLLNKNWAITAAHCIEAYLEQQTESILDPIQPDAPSKINLKIGDIDTLQVNEDAVLVSVKTIVKHPHFNSQTLENDLALLEFSEPVIFQRHIVPICIPDNDDDFIDKTATVTGWGRISDHGPFLSRLQEVSVPIISNKDCESRYFQTGHLQPISNSLICAGEKEGGKDSCDGDSGGPMVIQKDNRWVLAGVTSWGTSCGKPNEPGIYTRVSKYRNWINEHITSK